MSTHKRQSFEERSELDDRLTSKHIRTLLHLQDVNGQSERLKNRVAFLEVCEIKAEKCDLLEKELEHLKNELLKCKDIHEKAKDSKDRLQEMQKQCNAKIDQNNRQLAYKHEQEMIRLVSEKLEEGNCWAMEKEKLNKRIKEIENENSILNDKVVELENRCGDEKLSQLKELQTAIDRFKKENGELEEAKSTLQKGIHELTRENDSLRTSLESVNKKVKVLEVQLRQVQEEHRVEPEKPEPTPDLTPQIKELQEHVNKLEKTINELKTDNEEKKVSIDALEFSLQDSSQALKHLYKERDLLKNRIAGLLNEIEILKLHAPEPRQTFTEYVQLKRDFTTLRDEHDKLLKKRGSKPNVLPCLTADSRTVSRTFSGSSFKSKSSSNE